jgi:uncharacterized protein YjbI with pentapeptide repeats
LRLAEARDAHFDRARLLGAQLQNGHFEHASFRGADLTAAVFAGGKFDKADFTGASLRGAFIGGADLSGARGLTHEQLGDACADHATRLPRGFGDVRTCGYHGVVVFHRAQ